MKFSPEAQAATEYAQSHFSKNVEALKELVRIPSISFPGFDPKTLVKSAEAVCQLLVDSGFENVEQLKFEGAPPYVYADWLHAPGRPTLLLYAHHDVQPPMREALWKTPPFEPVEKDGRLYGRGSADDKAGIIVHAAAVASFLKTSGKLPVNVKILIEGEEEVGSEHLEDLLSKYKDKLQSDVMVLTDTSNYDTGIPTITTSLRGIVAVEVEVQALKSPVHSGSWGGPCPDPILALSKMLGSLVNDEGQIQIPGIYDDVAPLTPVEINSIDSLKYTDALYRSQSGMLEGTHLLGGRSNPLTKMTRIPSIAVNAIEAGSKKAPANVIMGSAWAKVGIRTVPNMDGEKTLTALKDYLLKQAPWGVKVTFRNEAVGPWWLTEPKGPVFEKAHAALTAAFGKECVYLGQGGSIPFVGPFSKVLGGAPALLIGVEDPYTYAHSENESVHLDDLRKSIVGAINLYSLLGV